MSGEIVTVFRSRLRDDAGEGYGRTADVMEERARAMQGFVDFKTFVSADGERRGRAEWHAEYSILVCDLVAERNFTHHAVAVLTPLPEPRSTFDRMVAQGRVRRAIGTIDDIPPPLGPKSTAGTDALRADREGKV
jgi:hypothetical protein